MLMLEIIFIVLRPELLLESLVSPIPRAVLDSIIMYNDIDAFLELLKSRKFQRDMAKSGSFLKSTHNVDINASLKNVMNCTFRSRNRLLNIRCSFLDVWKRME